MKFIKILLALVLLVAWFGILFSQEAETKTETTIEELKDRIDGIDENQQGLLNDVLGLKKIKVSGYLQINFEKTENAKGLFNNPYDKNEPVLSRFRVRRSRLKVNYDAGSTQMVIQGDYSNSGFTLKDAYLEFTEPWMKWFTLRTGVFNRPNYEIEYSSSQRESMERSTVIRNLYPDERDLGAMMTINPSDWFTLQLAGFNNTFQGDLKQAAGPNFRDEPLYFMGRITKSLDFSSIGLGIDLGAHARFGNAVTKTPYLASSDMAFPGKFKMYTADSNKLFALKTNKIGATVSRSWYGVEAQVYYDFLGGMKLMGEYIFGSDVNDFADTISIESRSIKETKDYLDTGKTKYISKFDTSYKYDGNNQIVRKRDFNGFYVMLVKNIFTDWQVAVKYDEYTPNKTLKPDNALSEKDLKVSTLGFGIHNYTFPNVRLSLWYDMNHVQTSNSVTEFNKDGTPKKYLMQVDLPKNLLTIRLQYKF